MKVIIAGGRDFSDMDLLSRKCDRILRDIPPHEITIISGNASGADTLGVQYAYDRKIKVEHYPANWYGVGKGAGEIRNIEMAKNADALIAFWDGKSRGTKHMIDTAVKRGLKFRVIKY